MEIKYINRGIAFQYGNIIEINRNLLKYPDLYNEVLKHELQHYNNKNSLINDIFLEIKDLFNFKKQKQLKEVTEKYEKFGWQSTLPVWFEGKNVFYNLPLIIIYLFIFTTFSLLSLLLMRL